MSRDEKQIEAAALNLDARSRARLAERLLESLDELSETEVQALWTEEAQRRDAELYEGTDTARSAEDVLRDARAKLR